MEWRKSPQHLIETFNSVVPGPPVVPRKMFGYPAAFVNGNLFMSLFQTAWFCASRNQIVPNSSNTRTRECSKSCLGAPCGNTLCCRPSWFEIRKDSGLG